MSRPSYPNIDRTIRIYKTGSSNNKDSWRYNLSRILNTVETEHSGSEYLVPLKRISDYSTNFDVNEKIHLLMDGELPKFKSSNQWDKPMAPVIDAFNASGADKLNAIMTIFDGVKSAVHGTWKDSDGATASVFMPWIKNLQAWNGTKAFGISVEFKFALGQYGLWNAREEVVKPILNLIAPSLPQHINAFSMAGNTPSSFNLISEMILNVYKTIKEGGDNDEWKAVEKDWNTLTNSGLTLENLVDKIGQVGNVLGSFLEFLALSSFKRYSYTIEFGNLFTMNRMLIKDSSWTFSKEVDQYGLPVFGSATLEMESMIPLALTSSSNNNMSMRFNFGGTPLNVNEQV